MKFEQVKAWKMAGRVAASLALGAAATAQTAGGETSLVTKKGIDLTQVSLEGDIRDTSLFTKRGIELTRVSLDGDIRTAEPARGMIVLQRPAHRELELVFKLHPLRNSGAGALIPTLDDMASTLVLQNGTPGAVAVIHLESRAPELRRAKGTRIVGFFDEDGKFEGPLPEGFKPRGIFGHGEEVTWFGLVKKPVSGHAVPASKRPVMEEVDLEELVEQTYVNWIKLYTNLEFRTDRSVRRPVIVEDAGTTVESLGGAEEVYVELASPQGGGRALEKIPLQRPRKPVLGSGHTKPGASVDDEVMSGKPVVEPNLPADPQGGRRAGEKIELQRPKPRRDHVLVHKR